jgi:hypothetical protein
MVNSYMVEVFAAKLFKNGFWFTYYELRNDFVYKCSRLEALWVIFVAHRYMKRLDYVKYWYNL